MTAALRQLAQGLDGRPVAISRAVAAQDRAVLEGAGTVVVLPIVGGVTVWGARPPDVVAVVVTPNHLGVEERLPGDGAWCGVRRSEGVASHPDLLDDLTESRPLRTVQRLARRLTSIGGVQAYHADIVAPWFTAMAADPGMLDVEAVGLRIEVLGPSFPDIPGGVRIEVAADAADADLARYAAAVEAAAGRTGR